MNSRSQRPSWIQIDQSDNEPRYFHTSTLVDNYIFTFGGAERHQRKRGPDMTIFDVSTYQWKKFELKGEPPKARYGHTACKIQENKVLIYGGEVETDDETTSEILIITLTDSEDEEGIMINWKTKDVQGETRAVYNHVAEVYQGNMYVFGGSESKTSHATNDLYKLDLEEFQWTKCQATGDIPSARSRHRSVIYRDKMFVFGGRSQLDANLRMNDLFCLDLNNLNWKEVKCTGEIPSPRNGMSLLEYHDTLYLFGGAISEYTCVNELFTFSLKEEKNEWRREKAKNKLPGTRANHSCVPYKNGFFVLGGADYERKMRLSDIFFLNLSSTTQEKTHSSFQADISHSFLKKEFSDVSFVVEGEIFPAHKTIIANRCNYFVKMFSSGMVESQAGKIEIPDCKAPVFKGLLEYIYCDKIASLEPIALNLYILANKWRYEELERYCESYLVGNLDHENILEVTNVVNRIESRRLVDATHDFIIKNLEELKRNKELFKLSGEIMVDILEKLQKKWESCKCRKRLLS